MKKKSHLENLLYSFMLEKALGSSETLVNHWLPNGEDLVPDPVSLPACQEAGVLSQLRGSNRELRGASTLLTSLTLIPPSLCF